jgi:uncharacterized membrane protein YfcA
MQIRAHTQRSLRSYGWGLLGVFIGFSAALFAPPEYFGVITTLLLAGSVGGAALLRSNMASGTPDYSRVTKSERRRFLIENTAWLLASVLGWLAIIPIGLLVQSLPERVLLGHLALIVGTMSLWMLAKTAARHSDRVLVSSSLALAITPADPPS